MTDVRVCEVCRHADREAIERALVRGETYRALAARFGPSRSTIHRHRREGHLLPRLARAHDAEVVASADHLLSRVVALEDDARRILGRAEAAGDLRTAVAAVRELTRLVELLARLRGELTEPASQTTNYVILLGGGAPRALPEAPP